MHDGSKQPRRQGTQPHNLKHVPTAFLTDEQLALVNEGRSEVNRRQRKPLCGAATSTYREQRPNAAQSPTCSMTAGYGTDHFGYGRCKFHGGNTPTGRKFAALEMARALSDRYNEELQEALLAARFGGHRLSLPTVSPEEWLMEEVQRSAAMVRWLEEQIGLWPTTGPDDLGGLPQLVAESSKGVPGTTDHAAWMQVYREERKHAATVAKMALDAGVAEAHVRIAQAQGAMLSKGLRIILTSLGLTSMQAELARTVVPKVLGALSSGSVDALPEDLRTIEGAVAEATVADAMDQAVALMASPRETDT